MCGIIGFVDYTEQTNREKLIEMTDSMVHRGPDSSGYSFYKENGFSLGLGHRRLSIMDLSSHGHQPMTFDAYEIIYNGEVYNFKEIREELEQLGLTFYSDSDTEVILKAYAQWGIKSVDKFIGMFSICIFDKKENKLILIRDRTGIKPYYWYYKDNLFMFSSELKAFYKHHSFEKVIDSNALALYLQYGYILQPHTIFKNCYKLKAGHYLEFDLESREVVEKVYWSVLDFYEKPVIHMSESEVLQKTDELLTSAFQYRMVSDVPVGIFLSGGYDSSLLAAILQKNSDEKINMYTIAFEEKGFNEAPYAREVAKYLGARHIEYCCTAKDALEIIPTLSEIYDEPFGDSSAIPTILVSRLAKKDVTVVLSADGGDEVFCGYNKYDRVVNYYNKLERIPPVLRKIFYIGFKFLNVLKISNRKTKLLEKILKDGSSNALLKYTSQMINSQDIKSLVNHCSHEAVSSFDVKVDSNGDILNQIMASDYQTYLTDDILTKVDRATMSVSLEGREPLLDHRIIEFMAQLPSSIKYKNSEKKWILKEITHKYLPKELMDRPKKGFSIPLTDWLKNDLKEYFLKYLNEERLEREGLLNVVEVIRLRDSYLNGNHKKESVRILWNILMFEVWYEKWMR